MEAAAVANPRRGASLRSGCKIESLRPPLQKKISGEQIPKRFHRFVTERSKVVKRQFELGIGALAVACLTLLPTGNLLQAQEAAPNSFLKANLTSFNQVPSVLAPSSGRFEAEVNPDDTISFSLTYQTLTSAVQQAHIHFGASQTNGGVAVFLCGGVKPACPASGTVTGVITAADVSVLPANNPDSVIPQGIPPGRFSRPVRGDSLRRRYLYQCPYGELSEWRTSWAG